jgi:hypothetical protein
LNIDGQETSGIIDVNKKFREQDLALLLANSEQAMEETRQAFGIPDMPPPEVEEEIAETNKTKRKKKSELELEPEPAYSYDNE